MVFSKSDNLLEELATLHGPACPTASMTGLPPVPSKVTTPLWPSNLPDTFKSSTREPRNSNNYQKSLSISERLTSILRRNVELKALKSLANSTSSTKLCKCALAIVLRPPWTESMKVLLIKMTRPMPFSLLILFKWLSFISSTSHSRS